MDAWNVTVQRQITNTISSEVAYVGSKGTHGFAGNGPNYDVNPVALAGTRTICGRRTRRNKLGGSSARLPRTAPSAMRDVRLGHQYLRSGIGFDLGNYYGNDAASTYNAFEVKVDKRFSQGLQFLTHYTFSHADNYTDNYYAINH